MKGNERIGELIRILNLKPHPEGGYYNEVFRSEQEVIQTSTGKKRSAITTIYFLMVSGKPSQWHRISEDEIWHYYEGSPLELAWVGNENCREELLGPVSGLNQQVAVVPAGCWQASRTTGEYSLAGCTVGPGFSYGDFELLRAASDEDTFIRKRFPDIWSRMKAWEK